MVFMTQKYFIEITSQLCVYFESILSKNSFLKGLSITGNRKSSFIIFPSHKIIVQNILSYRKLWNLRWGPAGRCETQLAPLMWRVDCLYSPPPQGFTCVICGESYIYWVQGNNSSVCSVAVTLSCDTLVLTTLSSFSLSTSSLFFFLPWERVSWTFLGCHYANFLTRSLGCLERFSNSPLSFLGCLSHGPASRLSITRTIWWEWTRS